MKALHFDNVYEENDRKRRTLYTLSAYPGSIVYGEETVRIGSKEYRSWDVRRSKLAAAILKGINQIGIREGNSVLYLGAATGTTVSHISDIVGKKGFIFAVDFAPRVLRELVCVCEARTNIAPVFGDARNPVHLAPMVCTVDCLYMDVAQKGQAEIFMRNCDVFLKKGGFALLAFKSRSEDISKDPAILYTEVKRKLELRLTLIDYKKLDPFEKDHCLFIVKKK